MGKKIKKPGKGKEKTEKKTAKAAEKRTRREDKNVGEEDDIDAILVCMPLLGLPVCICSWRYRSAPVSPPDIGNSIHVHR